MDGSSPILIVMPIIILLALFTTIAPAFIADSRPGRSHARGRLAYADGLKRVRDAGRKARLPNPRANDAASVEYLYVPCVRVRYRGYPAGTRRWVQEVPIVRKTAKWIYYGSDSWDRREAVVSPGCISREDFEAGVIPIPGDRHRPGPASWRFFTTRDAAEADLHRGERERTGQAARQAQAIKELRRAMADAHPDRGGTAERFIEAHRRYETALRYG